MQDLKIYISTFEFLFRMLRNMLQLSEGENQEREKHGIWEMRSNRKAKGKPGMTGRKCAKMTVVCQGGLEKNHPGASQEYARPQENCVQ